MEHGGSHAIASVCQRVSACLRVGWCVVQIFAEVVADLLEVSERDVASVVLIEQLEHLLDLKDETHRHTGGTFAARHMSHGQRRAGARRTEKKQ